MQPRFLWGMTAVLAVSVVPSLAGAVTTGNVTGTVIDCRDNSRLPRAQVLFRDAGSGTLERRATSDGKGNFSALGLPEGRYLVQILAPARNGLHLVTVDSGDVANYRLGASVNGECKPFALARPPGTADRTTIR